MPTGGGWGGAAAVRRRGDAAGTDPVPGPSTAGVLQGVRRATRSAAAGAWSDGLSMARRRPFVGGETEPGLAARARPWPVVGSRRRGGGPAAWSVRSIWRGDGGGWRGCRDGRAWRAPPGPVPGSRGMACRGGLACTGWPSGPGWPAGGLGAGAGACVRRGDCAGVDPLGGEIGVSPENTAWTLLVSVACSAASLLRPRRPFLRSSWRVRSERPQKSSLSSAVSFSPRPRLRLEGPVGSRCGMRYLTAELSPGASCAVGRRPTTTAG